MSEDLAALSRRCEESARRQAALHREVDRFGPFEALLDRDDDMIWLNYAVPVAPLSDAAGARAALVGLGELAGVATLPTLRRRGVAATLCSALSEAFFAAGGALAWLSAGDEVARAVYDQIGYRLVDERLNYIAR